MRLLCCIAFLLASCHPDIGLQKELSARQTELNEATSTVSELRAERNDLQRQVRELQERLRHRSEYEKCVQLNTIRWGDTWSVCNDSNDVLIAPVAGRYVMLRGLGCDGTVYEDSFAVFESIETANAYILQIACERKDK